MAWTDAKESKREDIDNRLKTIGGDMLKMEYLENCLKNNSTFDIKKFIHIKLAELYEKRLMLSDAAKNIDAAAEISPTYREKTDLYKKEVEILAKHGSLDSAEAAFKKAIAAANTKEREEIKKYFKDVYFSRALELEKMQKNNNAIKFYERLLVFGFVSELEKKNINAKLAVLYRKVGKITESMRLGG